MNDIAFLEQGHRHMVDQAPHGEAGLGQFRARRPAMSMVSQYFAILSRRRWLILGSIAVALVIGLVATLLTTRLYTASATVEIQRESSNIISVSGVEPKASGVNLEFYETQYGLLRSYSLAERVANELHLSDDAHFFAMFKVAGSE